MQRKKVHMPPPLAGKINKTKYLHRLSGDADINNQNGIFFKTVETVNFLLHEQFKSFKEQLSQRKILNYQLEHKKCP